METKVRLAAEALGQQLVNSQEYLAMQQAEEAALADEALQQQFREYSLLRQQLHELMNQKDPDSGEVARLSEDIDRVQNGLQAMENMDRLNQARGDFGQLMEDVNLVIQGFLSPEEEGEEGFSGCGSGGCAGCTGCR